MADLVKEPQRTWGTQPPPIKIKMKYLNTYSCHPCVQYIWSPFCLTDGASYTTGAKLQQFMNIKVSGRCLSGEITKKCLTKKKKTRSARVRHCQASAPYHSLCETVNEQWFGMRQMRWLFKRIFAQFYETKYRDKCPNQIPSSIF